MENRFILVIDQYDGISRYGIDLLSGAVSEYLPYVLPVCLADELTQKEMEESNVIAVGIAASHPLLSKCRETGRCLAPEKPEGYAISVGENPLNKERKAILISGHDEAGVLYGCVDFCNKYLGKFVYPRLYPFTDDFYKKPLHDLLPPWEYSVSPAIPRRAVWTWGHVIYDYRAFLDNMLRLRLNEIVIWNDRAPINAKEIVAYAHARGIRVVFGYAWGWGVHCDEIVKSLDKDSIAKLKASVLRTYEEEYAPLAADGIYFQSFTELAVEEIDGVNVADLVTKTVNEIGGELLSRYPTLHLQFGLHATSVKRYLDIIQKTDPRITIVWEDCGAFPYAYDPQRTEDFSETLALTQKLVSLRGENEKFGCVLKGMLNLDWTRFEHFSTPYILGERTRAFLRRRTEEKEKAWRLITAAWLKNAEYARKTIAGIAKGANAPIVQMLVEDAMLEEQIFFPTALCAEMLWTPEGDTGELTETVASYPTVHFAD